MQFLLKYRTNSDLYMPYLSHLQINCIFTIFNPEITVTNSYDVVNSLKAHHE